VHQYMRGERQLPPRRAKLGIQRCLPGRRTRCARRLVWVWQ
jgi:hypothetical protein